MDPALVIVILVCGFGILLVFINKKFSDISAGQGTSPELLEYLKTTNTRLATQSRDINERLDNAAKVISGVQRSVGEMSEIGRGMKDLQEFLRSPKLRGNIGEQVLKELLTQMLPKSSYTLQFAFKSGAKVDAAVKTSAGIIPIDSKFPMENFRRMGTSEIDLENKSFEKAFERDVKLHIESISKKYILPQEGTVDYALMYIPSEAVYYEIVNNQNLSDYSGKMRVLAVSPTTFYAYLKAILMSFEGQKIEARAREILTTIRAIQKDYTKVEDNLNTLQKHMTNAYNMMSSVLTTFGQLGHKISSTQSLGDSDTKELSE